MSKVNNNNNTKKNMNKSKQSPPQDDDFVSADDWFAAGQRVYFDASRKAIVPDKKKTTYKVFERVVMPKYSNPDATWLTMLPGFPQGSYGYSKVELALSQNKQLLTDVPRLYMDYVGQGASDKPREYPYSTVERANLVEAQWKKHNVKTTTVVALDFSSLVVMELLVRQQAREAQGIRHPRIAHVLCLNGGYFADGHAMGGVTNQTPLVRVHYGGLFQKMWGPLASADYKKQHKKLYKKELYEYQKVVKMNQGTKCLAKLLHFVDEHQKRADKWDLLTIYKDYCQVQGISFCLVATRDDPFEGYRQLDLVDMHMKPYADQVVTERVLGGPLVAWEQASLVADRVVQLVAAHKKPTTTMSTSSSSMTMKRHEPRNWTQLDTASSSTSLASSSYHSASWTSSPSMSHVDYGF